MNELNIDPLRVGRIQMALISALQDAEGSKEDKRLAAACLLERFITTEKESCYRTIPAYLGMASRLNRIGAQYPQYRAVESFVQNELY